MKIANKLESLAAYEPTVEKFDIVLDANESFLSPEGVLREKINKALSEVALNRYPDPTASKLCRAAADYYGVDFSQIVAGNGSDELISILVSSLLDSKSKIAISTPDFSMYAFYAHLAEHEVVSIGKDELCPKADVIIEEVKKSGADLLIFSNPCNPSGQGLLRTDVIRILESLDCIVVVDEAYMDFWDQSVIDCVGKYSNLIVLKTCSKAFGLAAARCGFVLSTKEIVDNVKKAKSPYNVNSFTQAAALEIFNDREYIKDSISRIIASRESLYAALCEIGANPIKCSTNFVLVKHERAKEIWQKLRAKGISVRNIMGDFLRITAGSDEENLRLVAELKEVL